MKKIPSLFKRDYEGNRQVIDEHVEGSEWVANGEGIATRKFDGTAAMIQDGVLYKRYDVKKGREVPENAIPCEPERNEHTGHWPHWVKVGDSPEDKYFNEAFENIPSDIRNGTFELVGEKVNGGKEGFTGRHHLIRHGSVKLSDCPRDFKGLKSYLEHESNKNIEGVVWHHPDGRMVKIKKKDFGFKW